MKYLIAVFTVLVFGFVFVDSASAAEVECHDFAGTLTQNPAGNNSRRYQTFTAGSSPLTEVTLNAYKMTEGATGNLFISIVELVGGEPSGATVASSTVFDQSMAADNLPLWSTAGLGEGNAFDCENIPTNQTFTWTTPISTLTPGTDYALEFHSTSFGQVGFPYYSGLPGEVAIGSTPWVCFGVGVCTSWSVYEHPVASGYNPDMAFGLYNQQVDGSGAGSGNINGWIGQFRDYSTLDDEGGGLLFTLGIVAIVFAVGMIYKIPFILLGAINAILFGLFTQEDIVEPWILLTAVTLAGLALVFKFFGGAGSKTDEG